MLQILKAHAKSIKLTSAYFSGGTNVYGCLNNVSRVEYVGETMFDLFIRSTYSISTASIAPAIYASVAYTRVMEWIWERYTLNAMHKWKHCTTYNNCLGTEWTSRQSAWLERNNPVAFWTGWAHWASHSDSSVVAKVAPHVLKTPTTRFVHAPLTTLAAYLASVAIEVRRIYRTSLALRTWHAWRALEGHLTLRPTHSNRPTFPPSPPTWARSCLSHFHTNPANPFCPSSRRSRRGLSSFWKSVACPCYGCYSRHVRRASWNAPVQTSVWVPFWHPSSFWSPNYPCHRGGLLIEPGGPRVLLRHSMM